MGFELLALTPERVVGRMPVAGNTQPYGLWHGGASCVLAETLASLGSFMYAQPDRISVGVDINATHHRSVTAGWVTGTATALQSRPDGCQLRNRDHQRRRRAGLYGPGHLPAGHPARRVERKEQCALSLSKRTLRQSSGRSRALGASSCIHGGLGEDLQHVVSLGRRVHEGQP